MSTIKVSNIQHGSAASAAITLDANGQATLNGLAFPTSGSLSGRNRIINGDMRIDQRNAGASVTPTSADVYIVDRWVAFRSQSSKYSIQQNAGSVTPPDGFEKYLGMTSLSAYSIVASDVFGIGHRIEGFNFADLGYGTANAKTATLSFWVRSSLTGTFGGSLQNSASNRSYPFSYSISAANTWEFKTITIPGDTSGTWLKTNEVGVQITFGAGVGSNYSGTAGAWAGSALYTATGATSVVGTNGATFYITGVQLEAGTVATPFERRSYGQELALCQRYYYRVVSSGASNNYARLSIWGQCASTTTAFAAVLFPVLMRIAPTALETTGTASNYALFNSSGSGVAATALTFNAASVHSGEATVTVTSGITAGNATVLTANNNTTAYLGWSAEL